MDIVLDTVGGETQERSLRVLKPGAILVLSYHLFLRQHKSVMAFEQRTFTWMYYDTLERDHGTVRSGKLATNVGLCSRWNKPAQHTRCSGVSRISAARSC